MKTFAFIFGAITLALYFASSTATALAQDDRLAATAVPFTQEANYMSLPGFVRWRQYLRSGQWISREEAITRLRGSGSIFTGGTPNNSEPSDSEPPNSSLPATPYSGKKEPVKKEGGG